MLGPRLKELRGKRSQEEIAEKIGISRARLSHYENERSQPDHELLTKLADFYEVGIDYLLGRTDKKEPTESKIIKHKDDDKEIEEMLNDPELKMWHKELKGTPEEIREEALNFLRYLKDQERGRKPGDKQK
ncbi:helix-turn-helix transcriptional regulator [Cytobacillus firmus]|uniref:helix-turn-helix domain-containing protein n=1 Tax=Cytobacillus firmus TaxID=1399 RepID=UPI00237A4F75|nr:helix-turn-helix transcriptional regulator [Cytobacillus firmus]MDD9312694.1 helix-turn-helix transcriptional regulator [Cytobacillus firmus]